MIAIHLNDQSTLGQMRELLTQACNPQPMLSAMAKRAEGVLKQHFRERNASSPNKLGGQRTNFWEQVEKSVVATDIDASAGTVNLSVRHAGFAQKLYGGVIRAKSAQALTIPLTAEAYGRSTEEFEQATGLKLFLIKPNGKALLATRAKGNRGIQVEYVLKSQVTQEADPEALPDESKLTNAILEAAEEEFLK